MMYHVNPRERIELERRCKKEKEEADLLAAEEKKKRLEM